jgi:hypothetical protein
MTTQDPVGTQGLLAPLSLVGSHRLGALCTGQQQCPVKGIDDASQRSAAMAAIEFVALKSMTIEVGYSGSAKQESRLAFRAFNFSKARRPFPRPSTFVCFGHHANTA